MLGSSICTLQLGMSQEVDIAAGQDPAAVLALTGALSLQAMQLGLAKAGYLSKAFASVRLSLLHTPQDWDAPCVSACSHLHVLSILAVRAIMDETSEHVHGRSSPGQARVVASATEAQNDVWARCVPQNDLERSSLG